MPPQQRRNSAVGKDTMLSVNIVELGSSVRGIGVGVGVVSEGEVTTTTKKTVESRRAKSPMQKLLMRKNNTTYYSGGVVKIKNHVAKSSRRRGRSGERKMYQGIRPSLRASGKQQQQQQHQSQSQSQKFGATPWAEIKTQIRRKSRDGVERIRRSLSRGSSDNRLKDVMAAILCDDDKKVLRIESTYYTNTNTTTEDTSILHNAHEEKKNKQHQPCNHSSQDNTATRIGSKITPVRRFSTSVLHAETEDGTMDDKTPSKKSSKSVHISRRYSTTSIPHTNKDNLQQPSDHSHHVRTGDHKRVRRRSRSSKAILHARSNDEITQLGNTYSSQQHGMARNRMSKSLHHANYDDMQLSNNHSHHDIHFPRVDSICDSVIGRTSSKYVLCNSDRALQQENDSKNHEHTRIVTRPHKRSTQRDEDCSRIEPSRLTKKDLTTTKTTLPTPKTPRRLTDSSLALSSPDSNTRHGNSCSLFGGRSRMHEKWHHRDLNTSRLSSCYECKVDDDDDDNDGQEGKEKAAHAVPVVSPSNKSGIETSNLQVTESKSKSRNKDTIRATQSRMDDDNEIFSANSKRSSVATDDASAENLHENKKGGRNALYCLYAFMACIFCLCYGVMAGFVGFGVHMYCCSDKEDTTFSDRQANGKNFSSNIYNSEEDGSELLSGIYLEADPSLSPSHNEKSADFELPSDSDDSMAMKLLYTSSPSHSPSKMPPSTSFLSSLPSSPPSSLPSLWRQPSSSSHESKCPDKLLKSVFLDDAELLEMRYEVVFHEGDDAKDSVGLLCVSLRYTGAAGWIGIAFSESTRNPQFGRKEAIIGIPGIRTSRAVTKEDGDNASLGQQVVVLEEGGPVFVNPGKYDIPAGGTEKGFSGPSLSFSSGIDKQTLMDGYVSANDAYLDTNGTIVSSFTNTKMSFAKNLREPDEIEIDPYEPTLLLYAVALLDRGGEYDGNPQWNYTHVNLLNSSLSDYQTEVLVRKRKRGHDNANIDKL